MKADPITTGVHLAGVGAVSAVTLDLLGVPLQPIIWSMFGGAVGSGFAPASGRIRAVVVYLASSLICSLLGHSAAVNYANGSILLADVAAACLAMIFHPGLALIVSSLPALLKFALEKVGVKS